MKSMSMGGNGGGLPTQQKILMASLLLLVKRGTSKEVTVGKLVQTYAKVRNNILFFVSNNATYVCQFFHLSMVLSNKLTILYFLFSASFQTV